MLCGSCGHFMGGGKASSICKTHEPPLLGFKAWGYQWFVHRNILKSLRPFLVGDFMHFLFLFFIQFAIAVGPKPPRGAAGRDVVRSTNLGMAFTQDVSQRVFEKAVTYSCSPVVCPCRQFHTLAISEWTVHAFGVNNVILNARIATSGDLVECDYKGVSLLPARCAHDICDWVRVRVNTSQWIHAVSESPQLVLIAARLRLHDSQFAELDVSADFAGIMPHPKCRRQVPGAELQSFELFCGGFAGWGQVLNELSNIGFPCAIRMSVDLDYKCIQMYQQSLGLSEQCLRGPWCFDVRDDLEPHLLIEADLRCFKWVHLLSTGRYDLATASPPCPPWSKANYGPGLNVEDGLLFLDTLGLLKLIQPRVVGIENVNGLLQHVHYQVVKDFLQFAGFRLRWSENLNLKDILPQNRDRLCMIATLVGDLDILPHICVPWPMQNHPTLYSKGIVMDVNALPQPWQEACKLTPGELHMYLRADMLPHNRENVMIQGGKKAKIDVFRYRVRTLQDNVGCLMASYGHAHHFPERTLQTSGLYGTLLLNANEIRFLSIPEMLACMGLIRKIWIPGDISETCHVIGNAIAVPHAAITVLNMLCFIRDDLDRIALHEKFQHFLDVRLHADNIEILSHHWGWSIVRSGDAIPPTVPIHDFCDVTIKCEQEQFTFRCQRELDLWSILLVVMGSLRPQELFVRPTGHLGVLIDLPKPFYVLTNEIQLEAKSPIQMHLHPSIHNAQEILLTPCTVVVTVEGLFVFHVANTGTIQNTFDVIADQFDHFHGFPCNKLCMPLDYDQTPDYHFMIMPTRLHQIDFPTLTEVDVDVSTGVVSFTPPSRLQEALKRTLQESGICQILKVFGWHLVQPIPDSMHENSASIMLVRRPGFLAIGSEDAKNCLMTLVFLCRLVNRRDIGTEPFIDVNFRLLGEFAWKGRMGLSASCTFFEFIWQSVCGIFHQSLALRFLIGGKQVNPSWPISNYLTDTMKERGQCTIHTVLQLKGGGPKIVLTERIPQNAPARVEDMDYGGPVVRPPRREIDVFYLDRHHFEDALQWVLDDWMRLPSQLNTMDTTEFLSMQFRIEDEMMTWHDNLEILLRFIKGLKETGVELMFSKLGWMITVQFVAWEEPTVARIVMFPKPVGQRASLFLMRKFLQMVLFKYALPKSQAEGGHSYVFTKVRVSGTDIHRAALPRSTMCSDFIDSWDQASNVVALPSSIRMLVNGKQSSAEWRLSDYARTGPAGDLVANVTFVYPLRGGGPSPKSEPSSTVRNMMATWLLTQGAEMTDVVDFVNALNKAGAIAVASVLEFKDKTRRMEALQTLADSLNLTIPKVNVKHQVKRKVQQRIPVDQALDLTQVTIKPDFFVNQDDTPCQQRATPGPGEAGVCLIASSDAIAWYDQAISADEQAMIVIGGCTCPCKERCLKIHLPAFLANEPIILDGCMHQLGRKQVKISESPAMKIPIAASAVVAITAFRDELSHEQWQQLQVSPVKFVLMTLFQDADQPTLLSPPWGRNFQDINGKQNRSDAFSFQCHVRLAETDLRRTLKASGKRGIYSIPKTEQKQIMPDFRIIWLQLDSVKMAVAAAAQQNSLGIVRNARNAGKLTRGIRFHKDDYEAAHAALKPGEEIPSQVSCQVFFKISPIPVGATSNEIQQWLTANQWKARPIRSLSGNTWLCGCEKPFDAVFATWDQQPILLKWVERRSSPQHMIIAGAPTFSKKVPNAKFDRPELLPLKEDPWGGYHPITNAGPVKPLPQPITRKLEAPIEDRFAAQQAEIESFRTEASRQIAQLQEGMTEIQAGMKNTNDTIEANQKAVQRELQTAKQETQRQLTDLSSAFNASLQTALSKQDASLGSQLSELKNLLLHRPTPAKKAKVTKPGEADVEVDDDDKLWLSNLRCTICLVGSCVDFFQHDIKATVLLFAWCVAPVLALLQRYPCINSTLHMPCQHQPECRPIPLAIGNTRMPFNFFAMHYACRVGEASHPGPTKLAIVNPTAVLKKVGNLLDLKADLFAVSETSATCITQNQVTKSFSDKGFKSFWSPPVSSQFDTIDGRPSFRGEALGTAIFTRLPSRLPRFHIPEALTNSLRFSCCVLHIKQRDVLFISIYGFPGATRCQNGVRMNDLLLTYVWDVIQNVNLPFIVAGDFNEPPSNLPIFEVFRHVGAFEVNQWYFNKFGFKLPATCRSATRNDTAIIHPLLGDALCDVQVCTDHQMGDHSPMVLTFDFDIHTDLGMKWILPQSWAQFSPSSDCIAQNYKALQHQYIPSPISSSKDVAPALEQWSSHVEHAIDVSIRQQHQFDPVRVPWNGLPTKFKGRCTPLKQTQPNVTTVRGDRPGGYIPPCEIFSELPKLKTRQVRRLMSLMRGLKSTRCDNTARANDLLNEWKRIRSAQGYGKSWEHWILGFEALPYLPCDVPPLDILDTCIAITKIDCDHACHSEHSQRQKSFRYRLSLDEALDFSKLTYKLMRDSGSPQISEVPAVRSANAVLCRSTKGLCKLKIADAAYPSFTLGAEAMFGDAKIFLTNQCENVLTFHCVEGVIPTVGRLVQNFIACSNHDLFHEFNKFWQPYWLRDPHEAQFSDTFCQDFLVEWDDIPFPHFPKIKIPLNDVTLWMDAIRALKPGKAVGSCGWRHEELRLLPQCCVQRLADIFHDAMDYEFDDYLMFARTTLLPKCDSPSSMNQIRPITIVSSLFRLFGKVVFRQVVNAWNPILPWGVMGGLPNKGVKDLALHQKILIENAIQMQQPIGGFSLDLVKAFNTFGRRIMFLAMTRMGMPCRIVSFWIRSLSKLIRFPEIKGFYGKGISSTVGAPEGDCLSVLAMIALSTAFYYRVNSEVLQIRAFAYADNWAWFCRNIHSHFRTLIKVLNFVKALGVHIDFSKSWHWGTSRELRAGSVVLQLLFPGEPDKILTRSHVKDLGESVNYGKFTPVDFIRARIETAIFRIKRLRRLPISVQDKCLKIQTSAWPAALYAADTTYIGRKHFQDLRCAVVHALIGTRNFANAWVAVSAVSRYLVDPFLFVLCSLVRLIRRLAHRDLTMAMNFIKFASQFEGKRAFGPATAFAVYCANAGWTLDQDGLLHCSMALTCNILRDPLPVILKTLKLAWPLVMLNEIDRKGVGDFIPDLSVSHRIFRVLPDDDQQLLLYFLTGAFQVESIKCKWKKDAVPLCPLCGEVDTRPHRYLHCRSFQHIRDQFVDAVRILSEFREEWVYMPLPRTSPEIDLCRLLHKMPTVQNVSAPLPCDTEQVTFYTDGGALWPAFPEARVASWAVVQDISPTLESRHVSAQIALNTSTQYPCVHVLALGPVPGEQTAGRGELFALLSAVQSACQLPACQTARFVTDAQYVVTIINKLEHHGLVWVAHKTLHADLIVALYDIWDPLRFSISKIRSHQDPLKAHSFPHLWDILGNACVDRGATAALVNLPSSILKLHRDQKDWMVRERNWLLEVFRYVVTLNRARIQAIDACQSQNDSQPVEIPDPSCRMPKQLTGDEAFQLLTSFSPIDYQSFCQAWVLPSDDTLQLFMQGATIASALLQWMQLLRWPVNLQEDYLCDDDWGISWVELYISFLHTTGCFLPIKLSGSGYNAHQVDFLSDEGLLAPKSKRSLAIQATCFQRAIAALPMLTLDRWFPIFKHGRVTSLKHLGWDIQITGIPCRPILPQQSTTMQTVRRLIQGPDHRRNLSDNMITSIDTPLLTIRKIPDLPMKERFKKYMAHRYVRRRDVAGG